MGTIGGIDEGPGGDDDSIDEDGLFNAVFEDVVEDVAEEPKAYVGCEKAPIRLPSNPSDPTPAEREKQPDAFASQAMVLDLRAGASARRQALHRSVCRA